MESAVLPGPLSASLESLSVKGRRHTESYLPPTHCLFKVQSFSSLSKSSINKYTSEEFTEGGHKWTVSIYPNGSEQRGGKDHISIYVELVDTCSYSAGWEVNAIINMFVYNQIEDTYLPLSDGGNVKRLHALSTERGVANFIGLDWFSDPSNGYLIKDTCVFGVDIFVLKQTRKGECLCLLDKPATANNDWTLIISKATLDRYETKAFPVGDYEWKLWIYPRGNENGKGFLSMLLSLDGSTLPPDTRVFVKLILRLTTTTQDPTKYYRVEREIYHHFGPQCLTYGDPKLISLAKLNDPTKGFVLNDNYNIEVKVTVLGTVVPLC